MEILVFGAGAMGSFFGGLLAARHEVTLVARADHARAIRLHGLRISGKTVRLARPSAVTRIPKDAAPEFVLVATKAYDTEEAMAALRPLAGRALFATLQNGLDNPDIIGRTAARVLAGTTAHGVTFVGPGEVRHAGVGDTVIGPWRGTSPKDAVWVRDVFEESGIRTRVTGDVRSELWAKLVVNAAINPLAALAGVPNGVLARDRGLAELLDGLAREAASVAVACGARVDSDELAHRALLVARRTAANRASMLQDLERGRATEIDAITGAVVRNAEDRGIPVPLNRAAYALVRARDSGRRRAP